MTDRFEEMMDRYLVPIDRLEGGPSESTYFLHRKGGLVYCEGYAHPPGGLYGCLIKYPDPAGHIDIFGRKFNWIHRRYEDGRHLVIVPYEEQVRRQMELLPELKERPPVPLYAEHFCHYLLSDFRGYFDGVRSLRLLMKSSPRLDEVVRSLEDLLDVPLERMGCTGSLAYGYFEEPLEDVDVIFFGAISQNLEVIRRIRDLKRREPEREVFELGKSWPLRFQHMKTIICPFFKYGKPEEIPLAEFRMELLNERVAAEGLVSDDRHSPYLPSVLGMDEVIIDGKRRGPIDLIIYDGAERGEFFAGSRLRADARLVRISRSAGDREALLVTSPGRIQPLSRG